jgi:ABC-type maltose transport system permease subunit
MHNAPVHESNLQAPVRQAVTASAAATAETRNKRNLPVPSVWGIVRQVLIQVFLLGVLAVVLFPILWIISMAVDPRGIARPTDLNLLPANATLDAFYDLLAKPFSNVLPIYFGEMLMNSLFVALGTAFFAVVLGASAAYAFSRFKFIGRQAGLLAFIVLLMLPATGTLIPLFILFNSIQVNTVIARGVPAYFNAFLVALLVFLVYRLVSGYLKANDERAFNPGPMFMTVCVGLLALVLILGTFFVMFERSPSYAANVDAPLAVVEGPLDAAKEEHNRRAQSLPRSEGTAIRAQNSATAAVAQRDALAALVADAPESDLGVWLQAEIDQRADAPDALSPVLLAAQEAADDAAAYAVLTDALAAAEENVLSTADSARRAGENVTNAQETLATAAAALETAQADYDAARASADNYVWQMMMALIPYILLAWAGAFALAGLLWGLSYLLRGVVAPRRFVTLLLIALMAAITIGLGTSSLQDRLGTSYPATVTLRVTLFGLSLAFASGQLPFAIWNLKGYFDTIPKDLEEAALIDGAGRLQTFFQVMLPLSMPAFAITVLFSFMGSWTEFILSWIFLTGNVKDYTLAMALVSMANGSNSAPPDMQKFAAMSLLISLPILLLFFAAQRWIVSGLTIGAVK